MTIENSQNSVKLCLLSSTAANNAIKFESFIQFQKIKYAESSSEAKQKKKRKILKVLINSKCTYYDNVIVFHNSSTLASVSCLRWTRRQAGTSPIAML